jgi:hypothetical protein
MTTVAASFSLCGKSTALDNSTALLRRRAKQVNRRTAFEGLFREVYTAKGAL